MIKIASKIFAIGFVLLLFSPLLMVNSDGETVGNQGGVLRYSSDYQLIPQSGDVGGGNLHWRLEGEAAREFRRALLQSVGNDTLYPDRANGDDTLDLEELMIYLKSAGILESYVQRGGELSSFRTSQHSYKYLNFTPQRDIEPNDYVKYYGVRITRSSLNTGSIADDTSGLLGTTSDDLTSLHIHFKISFHSGPGAEEYDLDMADTLLMGALWESLIMPVRIDYNNITNDQIDDLEDGLALKHDGILVKDGEPQGVVANNDNILPSDDFRFDATDNTVDISNNVISEGDNVTIVYAYGYDWEGNSEFSHWSYIVGINSFYSPDYDDGTLYIIRTPAGEILRYEAAMDGTDGPRARILWDEFNFLENPQVLFVLVVVFAYLTSMFPKKYYYDYRDTYPVKHQNRAEKSKGVHILGTLMVIALFVLYFIPTIGNFFVRGIILIILGILASVLSFVLAKYIYSRKKSQISDDILNPPVASTVTSQPTKKRTVKKKKKKKKKSPDSKKIYCDWCGEFFTIHKERNLMTVVCPVCNRRQRMLKEGYNYLLLDSEGKHSYSILTDFIKEGLSALVVTTKIPSKVEEKYGVRRAKIMWLSDHTSSEYKVLDPKRIEFEVTRALVNFAKNTDRGVIFIDGLEYLIVENGFEKISKFIKKTTDICSINAVTYIIYVNPNSLSMSELSIMKKEFDHTEDVRDPNFKKIKDTR